MNKAVFLLLFFPVMALANPGGWTPQYQKVSDIIIEGPDNDGRALIILEGGVPSNYIPADCNQSGNSAYNTVSLSTDKGRSIYSLALAALMSGKSVRVALSCIGNRPLITHIRMK